MILSIQYGSVDVLWRPKLFNRTVNQVMIPERHLQLEIQNEEAHSKGFKHSLLNKKTKLGASFSYIIFVYGYLAPFHLIYAKSSYVTYCQSSNLTDTSFNTL